MKWINVAKQQPNKEDAVIRDIHSKVCLDWMYIRKITPVFITATVNEEFGDDNFPSIEYEWLDESEVIVTYQELQYLEYKRGKQSFTQYLSNVYPNEFNKENNEETAKEWLIKVGISPSAFVDDRVKIFPEEYARYSLFELLILYYNHITKP